jgi:hypothetical protein
MQFPETLDETYERTLQGVNSANSELVHRLFQCVAVAFRPLRVEGLAEFLALNFNTGQIPTLREGCRLEDPIDAVLSTCSTLLFVVSVDDSTVIQFSHFSVKEFLISSRFSDKSDHFPPLPPFYDTCPYPRHASMSGDFTAPG